VTDNAAHQAPEGAPATPEPELVHGCPVSYSRGQRVVHVARERYLDVLRQLVADGFTMCTDLCGVDYLTHPGRTLPDGVAPERFEVVLNLIDVNRAERLRVRAQVPAADATLPSAFNVWPGTEAMEREAFDMFGIVFDGHPDLKRILLPDGWKGHPLRKDYSIIQQDQEWVQINLGIDSGQ
jgi:NADH-quinone oxidoreductase subunit C